MIVRAATRVEPLADDVARWLADARDDPFAEDVLLTGDSGMSRWLAQRLSRSLGADKGDGVCARVTFTSLSRFLGDLGSSEHSNPERVRAWSPEALFPLVLQCLDHLPEEVNLKSVIDYLAVPNRPRRRVEFARRTADRLAWHATWNRPMLRHWEAGNFVTTGGEQLDAMDRWQPSLWALLVQSVGLPWECDPRPPELERVARLGKVGAFLLPGVPDHEWQALLGLDDLLSRAGREVAIYELRQQPCEGLRRVAGEHPPYRIVEHELVGSPAAHPTTLLESLQASLAGGELRQCPLDDSLQIHLSHGPDRQVEVLHDIILGLLEGDPTLEPRDILVVTPDLEQYGPLVEAMFFNGPGAQARVTPSGFQAQTNPAMELLFHVLKAVNTAAGADSLWELLQSPLVMEGFELSSNDSFALRRMIEDSGIRWGVTQTSREAFAVDVAANTWESGLDRMVLGLALSSDDLPVHEGMTAMDLGSDDAARLVRAIAAVVSTVSPLTSIETLEGAGWVRLLVNVLNVLCPGPSLETVGAVQASTAVLTEALAELGPTTCLEVEAVLHLRWRRRTRRSSLLRGDLNVTSLGTLDCVPHRVLIHLGLDQANFPRHRSEPGDRVETILDPRVLDATARDRSWFLHSVQSARQKFIALCVGFDPTTNEPVTAPTPVLELVEAIECVSGQKLSPDQETLPTIVTHPAQPFSPSMRPRHTFDAAVAQAAQRLMEPRVVPSDSQMSFPTRRPPRRDLPVPATIELDDICSLFANPAAYWLKGVGVTPSSLKCDPAMPSDLPVDLDSLALWKMKDRLFGALGAGFDTAHAREAEVGRQLIPPQSWGSALVDSTLHTVTRSRARVADLLEVPVRVTGVRLGWDGLPEVRGSVFIRGGDVVSVRAGKVRGKQLIRAWIQVLALTCSRPEQSWRAVVAGDDSVRVLASPEADHAERLLMHLVHLYLAGRQSPLPLPADFSELKARASVRALNIADLARDMSGSFEWSEEWVALWESPDNLFSQPPQRGDGLEGDPPHDTRFCTLLTSVYGPLREAITRNGAASRLAPSPRAALSEERGRP
ncbi:MAG: exodeoxyribonuclease V subunit gamma [Propionibacteriaceae bacterium]|jgi:exodeoxyribonuclease V gamma subunit|nr:exodeoxyribonuclease V subunit gamma [Propionibacteriaceae bacterium]